MNIFEKFVRWLTKDIIDEEVNEALKENLEQRNIEYNKIQIFKLEEFVGKKVMVIGNEWEDIIYADAIGVEFVSQNSSPLLKIRNVLTNEVHVTFGKVFEYSPELYSALKKLTPFERWNIAAPHVSVPWDKYELKKLTDPDILEWQLKKCGFISERKS